MRDAVRGVPDVSSSGFGECGSNSVSSGIFSRHHPSLPPSPSRLRGSDLLRSATAAPSVKNSDVRRRHPASPAAIKFQYAAGCSISQLSRALIPTERSGEVAAADLAAQLSVACRLRVDETFTLSWKELSVKWCTHIRIL